MLALRLLVTGTVLPLLLGLAPATTASPVATPLRAKAGTTLTAAVTEPTVDYGASAVVTGTLTKSAAGTGIKGRSVTLHGRRTGTTSWTRLAATSTRSGGAYRFTVPDRTANYDFQARFAGTATLASDTSPVSTLRVRAPLTGVQVDPPGPNAIVGDTRTWTASTLAGLQGTEVTLQSAAPGKRWNYETSDFVRQDGSIELATTLYADGVRDYRLQLAGSARLVGSTSEPVRITTRKLTITTTALPEATVQLPYEVALRTTGADEPVVFSVSAGELPAGITLSQSGVLSGRATTVGSRTFTVQAYDERGQFTQRRLTLAVTEPTDPVLADTVLPGAQLGVGYAYQPLRVGGTAPFTWALTGGALPAGLTLNPATGLISGTPTTRQTSSVTLRVTDADGDATSATWPLVVGPAADWAQAGADGARSGFNRAESTLTAQTADRARLEWRLPGGHADVVAAGGVLYTGSAIPGSVEQGITARELASGRVLWTRPVVDASGSSPGCQRLAVTASSVLCDTGFEVLAVAREGAHQVRWSTAQTDPGVQSRDLLVVGDRVLVASYGDPSVTAYSLADGQLQWRRPLAGDFMGMAVGDGTVYVLSSDGISVPSLQTFSLAGTGTPGWTRSVPGAHFALVAVPGAVVVTAGRVAQWRSAANGAVLRSYESPVPIFGTPLADDRRLYLPTARFDEFGGWSGTGVTAVGLADAGRKWSVDTGYPIRAGTAVGADVLWVHASHLGSNRIPSEVVAVRTTDGRVLRRYAPDDTGFAPPIVAGGRAVIRTAYSADVLGVMAPAVRVPEAVLPVGWTGAAYRTRLTAEQGRAPYRWTVVGGALPAGLTLSPGGVLSGTPTTAGATSVRVRATDANGRSATQQFGVAVRTASSSTEWRTLGGGAARGGLAAGEAGITADTAAGFAMRWSTPEIPVPFGYPPGYWAEEPLAVGNRVFGVGGDGLLRAWNSGGGLNTPPLWTTPLPGDEQVVGTPTLAGSAATGTLYAATTAGRLLAVRAGAGTVAWSTPLFDPAETLAQGGVSPTVVGGLVVVQTGDEVTAVRTATHAVAWSEPLPGADYYDLFAPSTDGSRIFVYSRCAVVALDPADGSQLWRSTIAAPTSSCERVVGTFGNQERVAPVVDDGVVYANGIFTGAAAFDATTGAVRWRARLASTTPAPVVTEHWLVFASGYGDTLTVVDKATGTIVATGSGYEVNSSLTVAGDLVLFRSNESRIRAVDLTTMESVWTSSSLDPTSGWFFNPGPVAVSGGRVYAYTGHAKVVAFGGPG